MVDLNLESNEYIILQARDVTCYGEEELSLSELILTNFSLIYVIERKKLFKKYSEVQKYGFDSLAIKDGHIDATIANFRSFNACLRLQFKSGKEYIVFGTPSRKLITNWIVELNKAALGVLVEVGDKQKRGFGGMLAKGLKNGVLGTFGIERNEDINVVEKKEDTVNTVSHNSDENKSVFQPSLYVLDDAKNKEKTVTNQFCYNCGRKIPIHAKFCPACGTAIIKDIDESDLSNKPATKEHNTRKVEYVGKVLKCSNCGCVIGNRTMICPDCGNRIQREEASGSIELFHRRLMEIENSRKQGFLAAFDTSVDKQILAFIRSYPIPNSIDDIVDFITLAANSIDVSKSRRSIINKIDSDVTENQISEAWVIKMQQLYKKAEQIFPEDDAFLQVKEIYFSKMKELKRKV